MNSQGRRVNSTDRWAARAGRRGGGFGKGEGEDSADRVDEFWQGRGEKSAGWGNLVGKEDGGRRWSRVGESGASGRRGRPCG